MDQTIATNITCRECKKREAQLPSTRCNECIAYQAKWSSDKAQEALDKGLCPRCKIRGRGAKHKRCLTCRDKHKKYLKDRRDNETAQNETIAGNGQG